MVLRPAPGSAAVSSESLCGVRVCVSIATHLRSCVCRPSQGAGVQKWLTGQICRTDAFLVSRQELSWCSFLTPRCSVQCVPDPVLRPTACAMAHSLSRACADAALWVGRRTRDTRSREGCPGPALPWCRPWLGMRQLYLPGKDCAVYLQTQLKPPWPPAAVLLTLVFDQILRMPGRGTFAAICQ